MHLPLHVQRRLSEVRRITRSGPAVLVMYYIRLLDLIEADEARFVDPHLVGKMSAHLVIAAQRGELPSRALVDEFIASGAFSPRTTKELVGLQRNAEKAIPALRGSDLGQRTERNKVRPAVKVPRQIEDAAGYLYKPDPLTATTPGELVDRMRQFRIWAGEPSLRTLAHRSGGVFGASTLCKVLKGERLPSQDLVAAFVRACGGSEEDVQQWVTARRGFRVTPAKQDHPVSAVTSLPRVRNAS